MMPMRPNRHIPKGTKQGREAKRERDKANDRWRGSAASRGYDSRWQEARRAYLDANPLCCMCGADGRVTAATVVDHRIPHKGDAALFWDRDNWQPLCKPHHDREKQRIEKGGAPKPGIGIDG